jgi:hypothetical protein
MSAFVRESGTSVKTYLKTYLLTRTCLRYVLDKRVIIEYIILIHTSSPLIRRSRYVLRYVLSVS